MTDTAGLQTGCPEHHCICIQTSHAPTESVAQQQPVGSEVIFMGQCVHIMLGYGWLNTNGQCSMVNDDVIFTTIYATSVQATGQYLLDNYLGDCNMICANGAQLNVLLHSLVT